MKKILAMILAMTMLLAMTACARPNGTDSTDGPKETNGGNAVQNGVKITDAFTHEDPAELDFDERNVLFGDKSCGYAQMIAEQVGVTPEGIYAVIYGKDGVPVWYVEYAVFADEESTEKYRQWHAGLQAVAMEQDRTVVMYMLDTGAVAENIAALKDMNCLAEGSMEEYTNVWAEMNNLTPLAE